MSENDSIETSDSENGDILFERYWHCPVDKTELVPVKKKNNLIIIKKETFQEDNQAEIDRTKIPSDFHEFIINMLTKFFSEKEINQINMSESYCSKCKTNYYSPIEESNLEEFNQKILIRQFSQLLIWLPLIGILYVYILFQIRILYIDSPLFGFLALFLTYFSQTDFYRFFLILSLLFLVIFVGILVFSRSNLPKIVSNQYSISLIRYKDFLNIKNSFFTFLGLLIIMLIVIPIVIPFIPIGPPRVYPIAAYAVELFEGEETFTGDMTVFQTYQPRLTIQSREYHGVTSEVQFVNLESDNETKYDYISLAHFSSAGLLIYSEINETYEFSNNETLEIFTVESYNSNTFDQSNSVETYSYNRKVFYSNATSFFYDVTYIQEVVESVDIGDTISVEISTYLNDTLVQTAVRDFLVQSTYGDNFTINSPSRLIRVEIYDETNNLTGTYELLEP